MSAAPNTTYRPDQIPAAIASQLEGVDRTGFAVEIHHAGLCARIALPYALILPAANEAGRVLVADAEAHAAADRYRRRRGLYARLRALREANDRLREEAWIASSDGDTAS